MSGKSIRGAYFLLRQSASYDLVSISRKKKPIEQNDVSVVQGGPNLAGDKLCAGSHEEKRLGSRGDLLFGVEKNFADRVANRCSARLADGYYGRPFFTEPLSEQANLGGFSGALGTLKNDQLASRHTQPRVMIGLAAPFFMPSIIHWFTRSMILSKFSCAATAR